MEESPEFKFGDRVEIGGRTMLRPGFSLVGLTGIIFPNAPNAPAGCLTVAVDWVAHGYNEESGYPDGSLPLFVNVPAPHLSPAEAPAPPEELKPKKFEPKKTIDPKKGGDEPPGEDRPRLRLV